MGYESGLFVAGWFSPGIYFVVLATAEGRVSRSLAMFEQADPIPLS
jgi:hypothetical protein